MPRGEWGGRLRLAAERFAIGPEAFWRLSLPEWRALAEGTAPEVLGRGGLEGLMAEHPDEDAGLPPSRDQRKERG